MFFIRMKPFASGSPLRINPPSKFPIFFPHVKLQALMRFIPGYGYLSENANFALSAKVVGLTLSDLHIRRSAISVTRPMRKPLLKR